MANKSIPRELFGNGKPHEFRTYAYVGLDGERHTEELGWGDSLRSTRCPLDGVRLVSYSGDPHNVIECPCCHNHFEDGSAVNRYARQLEQKIGVLEDQLARNKQLLVLAKNPKHPIVQANLQDADSLDS